jgi:hypothetical protein
MSLYHHELDNLTLPRYRASPMMPRVMIVLTAGLASIVVAVAIVLSHSPLVVAGSNSISTERYIELEKGYMSTCQLARAIPRGTSAIRIGIEGTSISPAVKVRILSGSRVLREAGQVAGKGATPNVTVHVKSLTGAVTGVQVCTTVQPTGESLRFYGKPKIPAPHSPSPLQNVELQMEYLRPGPKSWWSLASSVTYRMGLGHAPSGAWSVILAIALTLTVVILTARLTLKELR